MPEIIASDFDAMPALGVDVSLDSQHEARRSYLAFDDLLAEYRNFSDSQRAKGNLFEQLVRSYLENDAEMSRQFAAVYSWRDYPGGGKLGKPDTGIDLVAIEHGDMPHDGVVTPDTPAVAIQCKFYQQGLRIQKEHVDSFLAASGRRPFKRGIFFDTTGAQWSKNAEEMLSERHSGVTRIGLSHMRQSNIDWSTYSLADPDVAPDVQARKSLRDHQVTAMNNVMQGFEHHDRGVLVMACGTGKTFTALKIAEKMAQENGDTLRMMFMVPSLALMSQTLHEWSAECSIPFSAWSVCSDTKVNRKRASSDDIADIAAVDLQYPPTTDPDKLCDSLLKSKDAGGLQVVFATYQSIDIVHQAQQLAGGQRRL